MKDAATPRSRFLALAVVLLSAPAVAGPFLDWRGLEAGPWAVGFRAVATTDATRTWLTPTDYRGRPRAGFGNRPVQVAIWYPAVAGSGAVPMTYGDYVDLLAWELGPVAAGPDDCRRARDRFERMSGSPVTPEAKARFETLYRERVLAMREAAAAPGRFPVLVSAPGQGYPSFDNSVLAELLASHGFLVVASPSVGPDGRDIPDSPLSIDTQARDLEFLAGFVQTLPQTDPDRIAAMGFSLGSASSALFALRNSRVKAFVSLDGVLRDDRYLATIRAFPQGRPELLRAPLLWIACAPAESLPGFGEGEFPELARYAELVRAVVPGLRHHDLSSMSSLQRRRLEDPSKDWTSATAGYETTARLILSFLQTRLAGRERDLTRFPDALCSVRVRPSRPLPPSPVDLREAAKVEGAAGAAELLRCVRAESPAELPSFEVPLVLMAYGALEEADPKRAQALFRLVVETFPASVDGYWGLGKSLLAEGRDDESEKAFVAAREKLNSDPSLTAEEKAGALERVDGAIERLRAKKGSRS